MIADDMNVGLIASENFCVCIRPDDYRFVPVDGGVRGALRNVLAETVSAFDQRAGDWERLDVSEDYGNPRKIFARRADELLTRLSGLFDLGDIGAASNISEDAGRIEFYFAQFWDRDHRKVVGIGKSPQFKAQLAARGRLMLWRGDTLSVIRDDVFRLKETFDALITDQHVYIFDPRITFQVAKVVEEVSRTAVTKADTIEVAVPFLSLSGIKEDIHKHARKAQLVTAISRRDDLQSISRELLEGVCRQHGVEFHEEDGKLVPDRKSELVFLEILDARRYAGQIIVGDGSRYRATGRQRVS